MPDVLNHFRERIDSALENKGYPAQPSSNFLWTTVTIDPDVSKISQDKDGGMILETKNSGETIKSNFLLARENWNLLEKNKRSKANKNKKKDVDYVFMTINEERLVK